jgi:hypothetical protein
MDQGDMEDRVVWPGVEAAVEELIRVEAGGAAH